MVTDDELLSALKQLYLQTVEIASFNHALASILIHRQMMSTQEFARALADARMNMAEAREKIQNMTPSKCS